MQYAEFVEAFVDKLEAIALEREAEGANTARAYAAIAEDLRQEHRKFYSKTLSYREAAAYSGYSMAAIKKWSAAGMVLTRRALPVRPVHLKPRMRVTSNKAETTVSRKLRRKAP